MFKVKADLFFCFFNLFYVEIGSSTLVALNGDVPLHPDPRVVLFVHEQSSVLCHPRVVALAGRVQIFTFYGRK